MTKRFLILAMVVASLAVATAGVAAEFRSGVEYTNFDGERLLLDASIPDGEGPFPIAILIHGGGWGGGDRAEVHVPPTKPFTDAGYSWISIDYRLAPKHRWPACIDDVRTAIRWVKEHAAEFKGNPNRIVLVGYSAGGHLAAFAAATADDDTRPQALVALAGPTDLVADCERRGEVSPALQALFDCGTGIDDNAREMLRATSPLNHVTAKSPPTLLIHGTVDESVPYAQSTAYQARLKELGVPCELIAVPGGDHRLRNWENLAPLYQQQMMDWLDRTLH